MTTPGDSSMASREEVYKLAAGGGAPVDVRRQSARVRKISYTMNAGQKMPCAMAQR
jgi:hypothetical protein